MKTTKTALLAAALVLGLGACENTTAAEGEATMQVSAIGDDTGSSRSQGALYTQSLSGAEGTVEFRARVFVRSSTSGWVELTQGAAKRAVVDASGRGSATAFTTAGVAATSYNRVRVEFEEVKANVTGSIQVGTGFLTGEVRVDLAGDNRTVVERSVDVSLSSGSRAELLINLNADAWMNQASAQSRTVSEAAFQSAVTVTAR